MPAERGARLRPVVIVQPSNAGARPRGPAIIIGPILAARDAETMAAWLAGEAMDRQRLGSLLQQAPSLRRASTSSAVRGSEPPAHQPALDRLAD